MVFKRRNYLDDRLYFRWRTSNCRLLFESKQIYKRNMFDKIYATNAVYNSDKALSREWFTEVNVMKYAAYYIEALNINRSVSVLMDPIKKMHALCDKYNIELPKSL